MDPIAQRDAAATAPLPGDQDPQPQPGLPGLLAAVGRWRNAPPERALWRELLDQALGPRGTIYIHGTRKVAAEAVWSLGAAFYFRADSAGIISGFNLHVLAADCRLTQRHAKAALAVLRRFRIVRAERPSRRAPQRYRLNLGGLDWPAVRRRVSEHLKDRRAAQLPLPEPSEWGPHVPTQAANGDLSGDPTSPLSGDPTSPPKGYTENKQQQQQQQSSPKPPSDRQTRGIASMAVELGEPIPTPRDRLEADVTFRALRARVRSKRAAEAERDTTEQCRGRKPAQGQRAGELRRAGDEVLDGGDLAVCPSCLSDAEPRSIRGGRCDRCRGLTNKQTETLRMTRKWER